MIRISDVFKKFKKKEKKEITQTQEIISVPPVSQIPKQETPSSALPSEPVQTDTVKNYFSRLSKFKTEKIEGEKPKTTELWISPIVTKETEIDSSEESIKLYEEMISFWREMLKENVDYRSLKTKTIIEQIEKIVDQLSLGNKKLLMLPLIKDSIDTNYLLCHSVNTCIYSLTVGWAIGYEKFTLIDLGVSGLLHDTGMIKYLDLASQPRKLTVKEHNEVKNHAILGWEILKGINGLSKIVSDVAHQHHERIDGSGYPLGQKDRGSINEYAKIVGLTDVYDAMVHKRAYRDAWLASRAVEEILNNKNAFEYELIKILLEKIGIFPLGGLVELSTKEIARVVKLNDEVSLRPVVEIIYDAGGNVPKEIQILDLTTQPTIYIKAGVLKDELEAKLIANRDKQN